MKIFPQIKEQLPLSRLLTISSLLFLIFYFLFIKLSAYIHNFFMPLYFTAFLPLHTEFVNEVDGIELEVMLIGSLIYILTASLLFFKPWFFSFTKNVFVKLVLIGTTLVILAKTNPYITGGFDANIHANKFSILLIGAVVFILYKFSKKHFKFSKKHFFILSLLLIIFTFFLILSSEEASVRDFNYLIGPALKILYGEKLGSFYMQYSVLLTYLFAAMMKLGLKINQIQAVISFSFVTLLIMYFYLSRKLIRDNFLFYTFIAALLVLRYFSNNFGSFIPQVSPFRLELWVILAIIAYKFGFRSIYTSIAFSLIYILDNYFGFLFMLIYMFILGFYFLAKPRISIPNIIKSGQLLVPICVSFIFQLYFFNSIFSQSGRIYGGLRVGFLPISPNSMLWLFIFIIPLFLYFLLKENQFEKKIYLFFLLLVSIAQLTYFFGRSHENNLLNISGILLLIFYITLDNFIKNYSVRKSAYIVSTIFIILCFVTFFEPINHQFHTAFYKIKSENLFPIHRVERGVDALRAANIQDTDKIVFVSTFDSYLNYRLGFRQIGYLSPFPAHIFVAETLGFINELIKEGYNPVYLKGENFFPDIVKSQLVHDSKLKFLIEDRGNFTEIRGIYIDQ